MLTVNLVDRYRLIASSPVNLGVGSGLPASNWAGSLCLTVNLPQFGGRASTTRRIDLIPPPGTSRSKL